MQYEFNTEDYSMEYSLISMVSIEETWMLSKAV